MKGTPESYFKGVVQEAKRVRWPKRDALLSSIAVVVIMVFFVALVLFLEDSAAQVIIEQLRNAFGSIR